MTACIDEEAETILEVSCISCVASQGGCKHAIAFLMWLHRRSEEPAPTEVVCYWKKAALSQVGSEEKFIEAENIGKKTKQYLLTMPDASGFFEAVLEATSKANYACPISTHYGTLTSVRRLSIHQLMIEFINSGLQQTADSFVNFCTQNVDTEDIQRASNLSHEQSDDSLWFELRYGRITASKLYEMAVCKTSSGSLVNQVIGVAKKFNTLATNRGKKLEKAVIVEVKKQLKVNVKTCGFTILQKCAVIGASPDGMTEDAVIEVKCPISDKTFERYINKNKEINKKYLAQINLQMLATNVVKGYFCVAHPNFETTSECTIQEVYYNAEFTENIIENALSFWKTYVFPILYDSCK